jgi:Zn-finger nucleic acid-binding protein
MKCPNCADTTLVMAERQGVEIDYCPACRGIWLDRGELDKLLEKAASAAPPMPSNPIPRERPRQDFEDSDYRHKQHYYANRKKSWLHEIFD